MISGLRRQVPGARRPRLPKWFQREIPDSAEFFQTRKILRELRLATVCEEAHCPNLGECWSQSAPAFQVLGKICTRACGFCAEAAGRPAAPDPTEPARIAEAAKRLGLRYLILTMPARDDLPDGGAKHLAACVRAAKALIAGLKVEVLTRDLGGKQENLTQVLEAEPEVFAHNVETVRRLSPRVRSRANHDRSLQILRWAAEAGARRKSTAGGKSPTRVKSGLMLGLGETAEEISETFSELRRAGVQILTLGQYLPPSPRHLALVRFVPPEEFSFWAGRARKMGFRVSAGPLVRSSYRAAELSR